MLPGPARSSRRYLAAPIRSALLPLDARPDRSRWTEGAPGVARARFWCDGSISASTIACSLTCVGPITAIDLQRLLRAEKPFKNCVGIASRKTHLHSFYFFCPSPTPSGRGPHSALLYAPK